MRKTLIIVLLIALLAPYSLMASTGNFIDNLMPDSPFYFLKSFKERVALIFTIDPQQRAEKALEYAKEKAYEAQQMTNTNNPSAVSKALGLYQYYMGIINDLASKSGTNIGNIKQKATDFANNDQSLKTMYQNLPPANQTTLMELLNRGVTSFKAIFIFLWESLFKIRDYLQSFSSKL